MGGAQHLLYSAVLTHFIQLISKVLPQQARQAYHADIPQSRSLRSGKESVESFKFQ